MSGLALEKSVDFHDIEVFEFNVILGDNPSVTAGAPIALGNELVSRSRIMVDFYEHSREKRRSRKRLMLPVPERAEMLLNHGYSIQEIANATTEAEKVRLDRYTSVSTQKWDRVNEMSERFGRVIRKALIPKRTSIAANTA